MATGSVVVLFRHRDGRFLLQFQDGSAPLQDGSAPRDKFLFSFLTGVVDGDPKEDDKGNPVATARRRALKDLHLELFNGEAGPFVQLVHPLTGEALFVFSPKAQLDWPIKILRGSGADFFSLKNLGQLLERGMLTPLACFVVGAIQSGQVGPKAPVAQ